MVLQAWWDLGCRASMVKLHLQAWWKYNLDYPEKLLSSVVVFCDRFHLILVSVLVCLKLWCHGVMFSQLHLDLGCCFPFGVLKERYIWLSPSFLLVSCTPFVVTHCCLFFVIRAAVARTRSSVPHMPTPLLMSPAHSLLQPYTSDDSPIPKLSSNSALAATTHTHQAETESASPECMDTKNTQAAPSWARQATQHVMMKPVQRKSKRGCAKAGCDALGQFTGFGVSETLSSLLAGEEKATAPSVYEMELDAGNACDLEDRLFQFYQVCACQCFCSSRSISYITSKFM